MSNMMTPRDMAIAALDDLKKTRFTDAALIAKAKQDVRAAFACAGLNLQTPQTEEEI